MKLLIVTQAVDKEDPVLGFFHAWIQELALHAEKITVICLREGRHALPSNVTVRSLGKKAHLQEKRDPQLQSSMIYHTRERLRYAWGFYKHLWQCRGYDAVFVHMNEEYVLLGGLWWRLRGTRIALWRNHLKGSWRTRLACFLAHEVLYTTPSAFVARFSRGRKMPMGIDTERFVPRGEAPRGSLLLLGRLDPVKNLEVVFDALTLLEGTPISCDVYGEPSVGHETYAKNLRRTYAQLEQSGILRYHGAVKNAETPALYAGHDIYINTTPSGSFDKTIGEAMACGALVVCANDAVRDVLPAAFLVESDSAESVAKGIEVALSLPEEERRALKEKLRRYVEKTHSLQLLIEKLVPLLSGHRP